MSALRIAVVGAGSMGRLHSRAIARRAERFGDCVLSRIVDRNLERSQCVADEFGGRAVDSLDACRGEVDVAAVAVPTRSHAEVTRTLLEWGVDVLVEKPMFANLSEATDIVQFALERRRILGVGHVEWYNTRLREAARRAGIPRVIEVERLSPSSDRGLDIDVVQDFMLHDLDWVTRIVGGEIVEVEAFGRVVVSEQLDEAEAILHFASGCRAHLRASRVHTTRSRRVRIEGSEETVEVDLFEKNRESSLQPPCSNALEIEPLDAEWDDFLRACQSRKAPENDGAVGISAIAMVERVRDAIAHHVERSSHDDDPSLRG